MVQRTRDFEDDPHKETHAAQKPAASKEPVLSVLDDLLSRNPNEIAREWKNRRKSK